MKNIEEKLLNPDLIRKFQDLDHWLVKNGDSNPRLEISAKAAFAEIKARSEYYMRNQA